MESPTPPLPTSPTPLSPSSPASPPRRREHSTGNRWESRYGYSRAVRVGDRVMVTGTLGIGRDGQLPPTAGEQAECALAIIAAALTALDATLADVVMVRAFLVEAADMDAVGEAFRRSIVEPTGVHPCLTQVVVKALATPEAVVEIEAEAWISAAGDGRGSAD